MEDWYMSTGEQMAASAKDTQHATMEQVLARMAEGQTVADAVASLGLKISAGAVRQWFRREPEWTERYEQAKRLLAQAMAEEAIRVARDSTNHSSAADRLLIDTLKWAASKANPAEYGERQTVEHQGAQTLQVKIVEDEVPVRSANALTAAQKDVASGALMKIAVDAPIPLISAGNIKS
jgi:hypothetical protein